MQRKCGGHEDMQEAGADRGGRRLLGTSNTIVGVSGGRSRVEEGRDETIIWIQDWKGWKRVDW